MTASAALRADPDRLLPADPRLRAIARRLYSTVADLPIVSPHGHVDAQLLVDDLPFADPATLLVSPDHYVTRLLHASGVQLADLGVGQHTLTEAQARRAWRLLCENWAVYRGTPVRYWLESELAEIFDVTERPSAETADSIYDQIAACLAKAEYRPRALFRRFGIEVLATTDDPADDLSAHRRLAADPTWTARVVPTFRPDRYLEPAAVGWRQDVERLGAAADVDTTTYGGYLRALEGRRRYFVEHGAVSADHSHLDVRTESLGGTDAARIYAAALRGEVTPGDATAFRRHMVFEMARMSTEDGLVMTLHPGVHRNHHTPTFNVFGADRGADIPVRVEFTRALQPLLDRFGSAPGFHLVLFTLDETVFSRELAPLAGFYPAVYLGAPWWFLDAPDAMLRFRSAVTETAGFSRSSGFIDDTRAFCSIPARHDASRRVEASFLARLVAEHRVSEDRAHEIIVDTVDSSPRRVFKL
jgi:glucuronate isomerase